MGRYRTVGLILVGLIAAALLLGCVLLFPRWLYPSLSVAELNRAKLVGMQRIDAVRDRLELQTTRGRRCCRDSVVPSCCWAPISRTAS